MLRKLLNSNINPWQTAAYVVANIVGLLIVGLAVQFYRDIRMADGQDKTDPFEYSRHTVVSHIAASSIFSQSRQGFTDKEIEDLSDQPWATSAAGFIPAGFDVTVGIDFAGRGFSSALFFEGVPEEYIDDLPSDWNFDPLHPEVAIILPRDYLALYNFGFAPARGLPVLDEHTVAMLPLRVTVSGNGLSQSFPAKIVGFSSRLNTIAVPDSFVAWANARFAPDADLNPQRVIIRLKEPGNPEIDRYLAENGLEEASNDATTSRLSYLLRIVAWTVTGVGLLISMLAAGLLVLSVFLLHQKNRKTISGLMGLGYTPHMVSACYMRFILSANVAILVISSIGTMVMARLWQPRLEALGMASSSVWPTLGVLAAIMAIISGVSGLTVNSIVRKNWRG